MFYIYKISNLINGKIYVGKSNNKSASRWKKHLTIAKGGKEKYPRLFFAVHAAIKKYGAHNFSFEKEIGSYANETVAFKAEKRAIKKYKRMGYTLYNLTTGGEGPSGAKRTTAARKKMSLARRKPGYTTGKQKLTIEQVKEIKHVLTKNKIKMKDIAKLFGVSFITISAINRGKQWLWVKIPNFRPAKRIGWKKLNDTQVRQIRIMLSAGVNRKSIAKKFDVAVSTIYAIGSGRRRSISL